MAQAGSHTNVMWDVRLKDGRTSLRLSGLGRSD